MARKPPASLPDVFAKPGQAPARGTPIEALPRKGQHKEGWAAPDPPRLGGPDGVPAASVTGPRPEAGMIPGTGAGDDWGKVATMDPAPQSSPGLSRGPGIPSISSAETPPAPPPRGPAWRIAIAALCVSLTTPFWHDSVLRGFGWFTALDREQQTDTIAISAQERRLREVEQRLTATTGQLSRAQADLLRAERQQRDATDWTRRMLLLRLSEALRQGAPFMTELAITRSAGAGTADIAPTLDLIAPYAPIGVPTRADLERDFRRLTDPVLRPYRALNPMAWARSAWGFFPFTQPADRDPARDAMREAAEYVRLGDIHGAAQLLRTANVEETIAGWLADADARAAADMLIRRVEALPRERRD